MWRPIGTFSAGLVMLLTAGLGCSDNGDINGNGGNGGTTTTSNSCVGDPDHPMTCTFWTCMNVPTQYGTKTHCTAQNPPGSPQPPGGYTCPQTNGGVYCPGNDAGGSGPWM